MRAFFLSFYFTYTRFLKSVVKFKFLSSKRFGEETFQKKENLHLIGIQEISLNGLQRHYSISEASWRHISCPFMLYGIDATFLRGNTWWVKWIALRSVLGACVQWHQDQWNHHCTNSFSFCIISLRLCTERLYISRNLYFQNQADFFACPVILIIV